MREEPGGGEREELGGEERKEPGRGTREELGGRAREEQGWRAREEPEGGVREASIAVLGEDRKRKRSVRLFFSCFFLCWNFGFRGMPGQKLSIIRWPQA